MILSRIGNHLKDIPAEIIALHAIIDNESRWKEAHNQFTEIRILKLENKYQPETYLRLAELVAKVTYNASGQPAPFDNDSGYYIASVALETADYFADKRIEAEVMSAILLFNRNKKFKHKLTAAKDFLLYQKIDDILWFDWDPIDINYIAPRDEYQSYVPEIFDLVKSKADRQEIAQRLFKLETDNMGLNGTLANCLRIADKIVEL